MPPIPFKGKEVPLKMLVFQVQSSGIADMVIKDARNAFKYVEDEMSKKNSD